MSATVLYAILSELFEAKRFHDGLRLFEETRSAFSPAAQEEFTRQFPFLSEQHTPGSMVWSNTMSQTREAVQA